MSRRIVLVLVALGVLLLGGAAAYNYMFATTTSYANYTAPTFDEGATDEQNIFQLQSDLGNAAAEMAQRHRAQITQARRRAVACESEV